MLLLLLLLLMAMVKQITQLQTNKAKKQNKEQNKNNATKSHFCFVSGNEKGTKILLISFCKKKKEKKIIKSYIIS